MKIKRPVSNRNEGFSLAELMVVIVIIGLLATVVVPNVMDRLAGAKTGVAKVNLEALKNAIDQYAIANDGVYPDSLDALVTPDENGHTYLRKKQLPLDPWKNDYQYESPNYSGELQLYSFGEDGSPGGEGDAADLYWGEE